jgi:hypothetical protein
MEVKPEQLEGQMKNGCKQQRLNLRGQLLVSHFWTTKEIKKL